jgi:hypothetical protein
VLEAFLLDEVRLVYILVRTEGNLFKHGLQTCDRKHYVDFIRNFNVHESQ